MKIAIIYISYLPYGPSCLENFLQSYIANKPLINHSLHIVIKGWSDNKNDTQLLLCEEILSNYEIEHTKHYSNDEYDISVYFSMAKKIRSDYFVFFNTNTKILHKKWLQYFINNITKPGVGVVAATGAWGDATLNKRMFNLLKKCTTLKVSFKEIKQLIFYYYNYYPTLKPHVRTNGFMIESKILSKLVFYKVSPSFLRIFMRLNEARHQALCFEHGRKSMSVQIESMNLHTLVVGADGKGYKQPEWYSSKTFWSGDQENLLVTDNQTEKYANGNASDRKAMTFSAWNKYN